MNITTKWTVAVCGIRCIAHSSMTRLMRDQLNRVSNGFAVESGSVHILHEPRDLLHTLQTRLRAAQRSVSIASLYIGVGTLEQQLVRALRDAMRDTPNLSVTFVLDYMRACRPDVAHARSSSLHVLAPLIENRARISLFHTPELSAVKKRLLPGRWSELIGVQHMKVYAIDDNVILSGANLSDVYFTNRQDRYYVIQDAALANYFHKLVHEIAQLSFRVEYDEPHFHITFPADEPNPCSQPQRFKQRFRKVVEPFVCPSPIVESPSQASTCMASQPAVTSDGALSLLSQSNQVKTWIFPSIQMGACGVDQDQRLTELVLSWNTHGSHISLASGYLNLTSHYTDLLLNAFGSVYVTTASPSANGFHSATGLAAQIPRAYSCAVERLLVDAHTRKPHDFLVFEYDRRGWTYHQKGLWLTAHSLHEKGDDRVAPVDRLPCLTMIGSPNFGYRSVERDLECQITIVTDDPELKQRMKLERDINNEYENQVNLNMFDKDTQRRLGSTIHLVSRMIRHYM